MTSTRLAAPWSPRENAYSLPGSMLLKLHLGEAPEHIPAHLDVRNGTLPPVTTIDGGVVDRLIRKNVGNARVSRVHTAAASLGRWGSQHLHFNDQEHICGLSRTFRIDVERGSPVAQLAAELSAVASVEYACPNYVCSVPFDAEPSPLPLIDEGDAWASRDMIQARDAMAYETGQSGVIVGLIDSGVAPHHAETVGRFRPGFDTVQLGASDFAVGVTLVGDVTRVDNKPVDAFVGHGMGCAGIIGANGHQIPPGLAGECSLLPIRVLGAARLSGKPQPVGLGALSDIDMGLKMAVELGAKVLNMSFGTADSSIAPHSPKPHADVVRYALMRGCVLVAASGNSGQEELYWPAAYDGVIAVGSARLDGTPSHFMTRNARVALCAPGERVATCNIDGYQLATGTSFAAPFVSAVAALLVSRGQRRSFPLNGEQVRRILVSSAVPWTSTRTDGCGVGTLDAVAALRALDQEIDQAPPTDAEPDAPDITDA